MEGILNSSHEMEISKVETCEVFEAGGGVCEMPSHDGSSEMFNLEKNTDTVNSSNPQIQEAPIAEVSKPIPPQEEISQNLCVEQNVNVTPVEINRPVVEPVNIENPNTNTNPNPNPNLNPNPNPFADFNNPVAQKPNATSNKRKSDNHVESNIEEKKNYNMRKNIRGVINENNFDTITIAAQREESERLARVQSLKKSVKHKFSHPTLESMLEDLPFDTELPNQKCFINACESQDPLAPKKLMNNVELKEVKILKVEDKKVDKKVWNQWFSEERSNVPVEESDEVVTIDSSSDDDCIILSDSDECEDDDPDEDHHNSGLHVRDVLNIPNEHGKVLVNVGHVESEPDIFVAPQIAKIIKPHQIGGVRFLFDNIIESTKRFNNSSGFGCILAHSMGLGKTLQVVCFCDIFLRHTDSKTILCVMPINTIQNWMKEFNMWIPEVSHNHEEVRPRQFSVFALDDQHKTLTSRANIILRWANEGGVLLIGYELFRVLGLKIIKKREGKKHENPEHKRLLDRIHMALVKPGPDLVICDEGHRIKNAHAGISVALKQIRSRRRIVLTGYPLQNNLLEYWCMVDFVRPNYLGSKTEFCNMFERPIQNGQCIDSTPEDIKLMRYRAHVLHSLLVGFVQRRSDSVLQTSLPQKLEYVILTKMTKYQRELYEAFMNEVVRKKKVPNPLKAFAVCCKIWNHPDVLYRFLKRKEADYDLDIEEPVPQETAAKCPPTDPAKLNKPKADASSLLSDEVMPKEFMPSLDNSLINEPPFYPNPSDQKCFYPNPMLQPPKDVTNNFWQDGVGSVNTQPLQPDYVGLMAKPPADMSNEEKLKCSSQIVDLDTKEVQFLKSEISTELDVASIPNASNIKPKVEIDPPTGSAIPKVVKPEVKTGNETISYDWALSLIKNYEPGLVRNSPKMEVFLCILEESIKLGDRVLLFSQSLLTLDLVELFLQSLTIPESQCNWKKNVSYFRLDGSTSSMEREKLVNEFNNNTDVKLFLISTRAGSLGINLTGANRVVVFDASWNPCHDTQAVHRIYRYGQRKSCFVYRIVMDNCLEKNIYDRQVKKQGMSDRVVDECNPDAHLSIRELTNLCYDKVEENQDVEFKEPVENYSDVVMRKIVTNYKSFLSKEPFYHESLLIDRKDKKLSQTEKKLAKRGYEIEKKASTKPTFMPNNIVNIIPANRDCMINHKISPQIIRKKPNEMFHQKPTMKFTRWIPAEVWQRQGMSSQEMMLPIDVAIPTNSTETSNIVVKAGEKVMVLKSPKGVYMQLESGKIIAIKTSAEAAQDRERMKAKKLNCPDVTTKKPFNMMNSMIFKNDPGRNRVERPSADDSDKDDVIVISDSINDNVEPTFDLTASNTNKSRTETNTNSTTKPIPISIPAPIPNQNKKDTVVPQIFPQNRTELPSTELRKDKQDTVTSVLPLKAPQEFEHQQKQYEPPPPLPPRNNYVEKHHNNFYGNIPNNSNYEAYPPHNLENHQHHLQAMPPTNRWENKSPEVFKPSLKISNIPAPYPSTAISDMNVFEKNEKAPQQAHQAHQPQQAHQAHQPQQAHQAHQPQQAHQTHQAHQVHQPQQAHPAHQPQQAHQSHQPQQTHPAHQAQQAHPAHPTHPAHQPQQAHSAHQPQQAHSAHQSQQAHPAHSAHQPVSDIMNVDQYSSSYPQQPCKEPEEHSFHHHSLNLNSNYYNSLPSTSSTEDNNGSLNSLYNSYNNKAEATNYSENLYDNSTDSSHANYHHHHHQQMSKYSYGYYQPQYLPNFSNKVYDNNAFSSVSTQYYLRRPSTYSTSSTNGVDLGFNFTEPQGWMKKHLPD